ncbi:MAG: single-stranded-DNA-specific exonuclease RecJ [Dehalococcoidia bacterium]|nr:single-stranded-DNA-specific exonuclease RecJ [Dehalococcoidia bacterium]
MTLDSTLPPPIPPAFEPAADAPQALDEAGVRLVKGGRRAWRLRLLPQNNAHRSLGYPDLIGLLLHQRGMRTTEQCREFLGDLAFTEHDPFQLPDMDRAVDRIMAAIRGGERIAIYSDFDVDGVTALAQLSEGLRELGADVLPYIPDRFGEGYGLNMPAITELSEQGARLMITADCGISAVDEVRHAIDCGVDVIIMDHHTLPPDLPEAYATVNPKAPDSIYPCRDLASGGLAYKLLQAVYAAAETTFDKERYVELAALATVCDMVPLYGENLHILRRGIEAMKRTRRPGLLALLDVAGVEQAQIDEGAFGWKIGPRLNAAGRIAHAMASFNLLTATDEATARGIASEIDRLNLERRQVQAECTRLARELIAEEELGPIIITGHESFSPGVVGLVAGRLAEEFHRPSIVYEIGEETSRASARSIPEFSIVAALQEAGDLFERYGGHSQAAGFTIKNSRLPELKARLAEIAGRELEGVDLRPSLDIDAVVPLRALRHEELGWLGRLSPFGIGNPQPTFLSPGVIVREARQVGADGDHLRLRLRDGTMTWSAIAFGQGDAEVREGMTCDVVYNVTPDRFSGGFQLEVLDIVESKAP